MTYDEDMPILVALAETTLNVCSPPSVAEMTIDTKNLTHVGTAYASMTPETGDLANLLQLVYDTCPPFDPNVLRKEAHVTLVYSRNAGVDLAKLDIDKLKTDYPRIKATVTGVEYWEGHDLAGYIVMTMESPQANEIHAKLVDAGAKHSFSTYQAHMTLCDTNGPKTPAIDQWLTDTNRHIARNSIELHFNAIEIMDIKE